jgi:hypothetical protein
MSDFQEVDDLKVNGVLTLHADPTLALQGATKQYVDGKTLGNVVMRFNGNGTVLRTGLGGTLITSYTFTITGWSLVADLTTNFSASLTTQDLLWYSGGAGTSITGGNNPAVTAALYGTDSALSGWTTSIPAGQILKFAVLTCSAATNVVLTLSIAR